MMGKKSIMILLLFLILALVSLLVVFELFSKQLFPFANTNNNNGQIACTMEAKLCPNGSYVARSGPNCEFATCPNNETSTTSQSSEENPVLPEENIFDFQVYRNDANNLSFQILPNLSVYKFVNITDWPLKITLSSSAFTCPEISDGVSERQAQKKIGDRIYCMNISSEGVAGSIYNNYNYSTIRNGKLLSINFVAQFPQCTNYDNPEQQQCLDEEAKFEVEIDKIINSIVNSIKVDGEYKNTTYYRRDTPFTFVNGVFEKELFPSSVEKMVIKYLGYDLKGDFNADGLEDIAFIATENDGGSKSFYSLFAFLSSPQGFVGSNDIFLGDRIKLQSIEFVDDKLIVNYFEHEPNQALVDEPKTSVNKKVQVFNYTQLVDLSLAQAIY